MHKLALALSLTLVATTAHADVVKTVFKAIAKAKDGRALHTDGVAYRATVRDASGITRDAVVRVSRGGADTKKLPDILGLAIKVKHETGDQDYLMVTALGQRGIGARVPRFSASFAGKSMSSIASFKSGDAQGPFTAKLPLSFVTPVDDRPENAVADQSFSVTMQSKNAPKQTLLQDVTVHFDRPLSVEETNALRFTPDHDGGGVKAFGLIERIRKSAYAGSQEGRGVAP